MKTKIPEHTKLIPESAQYLTLCEGKETAPTFSAMALINGKEAFGAKWLREGFAWHPSMDLAWVLGFPYMTIVVDGAPELEDKNKIKPFSQRSRDRVISRRTLFANLHKTQTGVDPIELADSEFLDVTEPRTLSKEDIFPLLSSDVISNGLSFYNLEAIVGPDMLCECMLELIESSGGKPVYNHSIFFNYLRCFFKRIHQSRYAGFVERLSKINFETYSNKISAENITRPISLTENYPSHMNIPCPSHVQWYDGDPDATWRAVADEGRGGFGGSYMPYRCLFTGPEGKILESLEKSHRVIDRWERNPDYVEVFTTIKTDLLVKAQLAVHQEPRPAEAMSIWFKKHKEFLLPRLRQLGKKKNTHRDAANDMLDFLGEQPSSPLVPREEQKSLNPPDEWELTFKQVEKILVPKVLELWDDKKEIKKLFKKVLRKSKEIAVKFQYDWDAEVFTRVWAEADFDELSEEQFNYMGELYEELVG